MSFFNLVKRILRISLLLTGICIYRFVVIITRYIPVLKDKIYVTPFARNWRNTWIGLKRFANKEWYFEAAAGNKAPNPRLLTTDGRTSLHLLDLLKKGRPLVLNFGNCS